MATTSIGAPGVVFPDGTTQSSVGATGVVVLNTYASSGTWTKPATVKSIRVTVVGGGGTGGAATTPNASSVGSSGGGGGGGGAAIRTYPAPSIPGPQPYTVGGATATSSFGSTVTVVSATGGVTGTSVGPGGGGGAGGAGGGGSNGNIAFAGSAGAPGTAAAAPAVGGSSYLGWSAINLRVPGVQAGNSGIGYGAGGNGGVRSPPSATQPGGAGLAGVVIVEEFY